MTKTKKIWIATCSLIIVGLISSFISGTVIEVYVENENIKKIFDLFNIICYIIVIILFIILIRRYGKRLDDK